MTRATPERWLRIAVRAEGEEAGALVAETMVEAGGRAVVEEDGAWVSYVEEPPDPAAWVEAFRADLGAFLGPEVDVSWSWQPHRDWETLWRVGLGARRVGARFVVAPSWDIPTVPPDTHLLRIDPGMAFGTAEHATTRIALRLLEDVVAPGERVLDVGSGSAILSIAAAALGASHATAIEMDPLACAEAEENLGRNQVSDRVDVRVGRFAGWDEPDRFAGVVSNMVRTRLLEALPGICDALAPGGWMVLSGCELHEASEMRARLDERGFVLLREVEEDGWWGAAFRQGSGRGSGAGTAGA